MLKVFSMGLLVSALSFASFPVLEVTVGALDPKKDKVESCIIYSAHKDIKLKEIQKLNGSASTREIQSGALFDQQIPSYQVSGFTKKGVKTKKFLLMEASEFLREREGKEARKLIELAADLCEMKNPFGG